MSTELLVSLFGAGLVVALAVSPRLRRALLAHLARRLSPITLKLLGPMTPKAFTAALLRAAIAKAQATRTGSVLPNHIIARVSDLEAQTWGPLLPDVARDAEAVLRERVQYDEAFVLLGRPTVILKADPLVRPRSPRFVMSTLGLDEQDGTTHRPSRVLFEDPTPLMAHGRPGLDDTSPVAEFEVIIAGQGTRKVELGEGSFTVGRSSGCAVVIDEDSVSRRHALISVTRQFTSVRDLGSHNGVFVGNAKADVEVLLSNGDTVALSATVALRVLRAGAQRRVAA